MQETRMAFQMMQVFSLLHAKRLRFDRSTLLCRLLILDVLRFDKEAISISLRLLVYDRILSALADPWLLFWGSKYARMSFLAMTILILCFHNQCFLCVLWWLVRPKNAVNCLLQIEQDSSEASTSVTGVLALALRSLRLSLSAQILFVSKSSEVVGCRSGSGVGEV